MAIRRIYKDDRGQYFKGEGFIFRLPNDVTGTHLTVYSVNCNGNVACARYFWDGKIRLVCSTNYWSPPAPFDP